jgi:ATP-dependent DNA ligase
VSPNKTDKLPSGAGWLHEIKHDGFRVIARKKGAQVRLYSRPGNDLTYRFPLIVETLARLRSRACPQWRLGFTYSCQVSTEHFEQFAEFALLPNRRLGALAVTVLAIPLARRGAATDCAAVQAAAALFRRG